MRRFSNRAGGAVILWALLCGYAARTCAADLAIDFQEDVPYGTGGGEKLSLDLAKPKNVEGPLPGLLFIHGGGWQAGNKKMFRQAIKEFAVEGYVVATVGYRFAPKHKTPAQIEDCKCAARWMRAHAKDLGVDPERLGAMGGSAGAHLAMMLGTMDSSDGLEGTGGWPEQSSKVQAVVSYFGPVDLTVRDLSNSPAAADVMQDVVRQILTNFVGGTPEEHVELLRQSSPITYVNAGDAPMLLFQGTRDKLVPYDQAFEMATALSKAGVEGRVELILGAGHGWMGKEMKRTQQAAIGFFDQHLKKKS